MFTRQKEYMGSQKMKILAKVVVENMNLTLIQMKEDNARLRTELVDFTREVHRTVVAKNHTHMDSPSAGNPPPTDLRLGSRRSSRKKTHTQTTRTGQTGTAPEASLHTDLLGY